MTIEADEKRYTEQELHDLIKQAQKQAVESTTVEERIAEYRAREAADDERREFWHNLILEVNEIADHVDGIRPLSAELGGQCETIADYLDELAEKLREQKEDD